VDHGWWKWRVGTGFQAWRRLSERRDGWGRNWRNFQYSFLRNRGWIFFILSLVLFVLGLMEGKEEDDVYKGWDMVEIARDLMGMVLVCVWKDGYGDVGLSGRLKSGNISRLLCCSPWEACPLLLFLGFFPWFPLLNSPVSTLSL